jgi:hypothetical protein
MVDNEKEKDFVLKDREDAGEASDKASGGEGPPLPAIDFSTFIMSLNASALVHLGVIEDPVTRQKVKNLPLGKQTVDMLRMLQEKTRGNLTETEEKLLEGILYDLKIAYVRQKG